MINIVCAIKNCFLYIQYISGIKCYRLHSRNFTMKHFFLFYMKKQQWKKDNPALSLYGNIGPNINIQARVVC